MEVLAMGHIRARKETGKLFFDFKYQNLRCREQTSLPDTPANKKKLEKMLERIEAEILLNQFDYKSTFPSSKLLPKFEDIQQKRRQQQNGTPFFKDFTEQWFNEMKGSWRISYIDSIRHILDKRLIPTFGEGDVSEIKKVDLMNFRADLSKQKKKNGDLLSPTHINRHMKIMRMILTEAADRFEFLTPFRNIKPLKVPKSDIEPFTFEEVNLILSTVRADFKDYYTVRFFTGMRTGEIHGLKWRFVDFEKRQILIRECFVRGRTEYTKTDESQREIHMSQPVFDALKAQHKVTGAISEYVFINSTGLPLNHSNMSNRVWLPLLRHLGLRRRTSYQTRHTAATLWLASGEAPEWIARQMGHANTEMLFRVYSRYVPNLTRQDGSAFDRLISQQFKEI
jgi:integrase